MPTKKVASKKVVRRRVKKATGKVATESASKEGYYIEDETLVDHVQTGFVNDITDKTPAEVEISLGFLVKSAEFENIRGHILLRVPCNVADIDLTYDKAKEWVDTKLEALHSEVLDMVEPE